MAKLDYLTNDFFAPFWTTGAVFSPEGKDLLAQVVKQSSGHVFGPSARSLDLLLWNREHINLSRKEIAHEHLHQKALNGRAGNTTL